MSVNPSTSDRWNRSLAEAAYLRRRWRPSVRDLDYLPLRDLLVVIKKFASQVGPGEVFDYGCGGAPYRDIFSSRRYVGADLVDGPQVDKVLDETGLTNEPDASFDTVLSSQVLEHVPDPPRYLAEAGRILKPGGHLILTTHGMFLEHGCPNDFFRWTGYGLEKTVSSAGFRVLETVKITPGTRASIYLINAAIDHARPRQHGVPHGFLAIFRRLWAVSMRPLTHLIAAILDSRPYVPSTAPEPIYIGVAVLATKP